MSLVSRSFSSNILYMLTEELLRTHCILFRTDTKEEEGRKWRQQLKKCTNRQNEESDRNKVSQTEGCKKKNHKKNPQKGAKKERKHEMV